jgi:hypothetical protein
MINRILERLGRLYDFADWYEDDYHVGKYSAYKDAIEIVQEVAKEYGNGWIPFTQRKITEEEKAEFIYETEYLLTCKLPDDNTEIIVCYKNGDVGIDTFFNDCGECYLDSGNELVDEVIAWQPLPAPYQKGE